jgi:S-adenosylmethionine/arginine decarboxylase-like enzyme
MTNIAMTGMSDRKARSGRRLHAGAIGPLPDIIPDYMKGKTDSMKKNESRFEPDGDVRPDDVWGVAASIDIYGCDPDAIRDADLIKRFTAELCDLIEMKRFGETQVVHFGEDERVAGFSMVQLIETSLISAHFANQSNAVYLDVFSCKSYDPETVREFARKYFHGQHTIMNVNYRR